MVIVAGTLIFLMTSGEGKVWSEKLQNNLPAAQNVSPETSQPSTIENHISRGGEDIQMHINGSNERLEEMHRESEERLEKSTKQLDVMLGNEEK